MKRLAIATLAVTALLPATASADVTATSQVSSTGVSLTVLGGDTQDRIRVTCGDDGNVKVNRADPASDSYPMGPGPVACDDLTTITVDGGAGRDWIVLSGVSAGSGFTNADLCGPCPGGGYAIVAECLAGAGSDLIKGSPIGTLIGGCSGRQSMPGNDSVIGSSGVDAIAAGPGIDHVHGGRGDDQLFGGPGVDDIFGNAGDDVLAGKQGDDLLAGGAGNDRLAGGPGRDGLFGGAGDDTCVGGPGGGHARTCESIRGGSRLASLGFAPREAVAEPRRR